MKKKILAVVLAVVILAVAAIGATLAWLMDKTEAVVNTFTLGNVTISLVEHNADGDEVTANEYKLIPGATYAKDPTVTVAGDSEACYLFIQVDAAGAHADALVYSVRQGENGWTALPGVDNVYYREVAASDDDQSFLVLTGVEGDDDLADGKITISGDLTSGDIAEITDETKPTLSFTAYAIQSDNLTPAEGQSEVAYAWALVSAVAEE